MEINQIVESLKKAREVAKKRNFTQSVDFSVVLKDVNLKNPEERIDDFLVLPNKVGKKVKVCALVDRELEVEAKKVFDHTITKSEFSEYAGNKSKIRKLAKQYDFFVAQATIMTDIAATFGKSFGPKGKMPNPKAGCILPPKPELLKPTYEKLQRTVAIRAKKQPVVNVIVGKEEMSDEDIAKNAMAVYDFVKRKLPRGDQQIKKLVVKLTMGKPVVVGA